MERLVQLAASTGRQHQEGQIKAPLKPKPLVGVPFTGREFSGQLSVSVDRVSAPIGLCSRSSGSVRGSGDAVTIDLLLAPATPATVDKAATRLGAVSPSPQLTPSPNWQACLYTQEATPCPSKLVTSSQVLLQKHGQREHSPTGERKVFI